MNFRGGLWNFGSNKKSGKNSKASNSNFQCKIGSHAMLFHAHINILSLPLLHAESALKLSAQSSNNLQLQSVSMKAHMAKSSRCQSGASRHLQRMHKDTLDLYNFDCFPLSNKTYLANTIVGVPGEVESRISSTRSTQVESKFEGKPTDAFKVSLKHLPSNS